MMFNTWKIKIWYGADPPQEFSWEGSFYSMPSEEEMIESIVDNNSFLKDFKHTIQIIEFQKVG